MKFSRVRPATSSPLRRTSAALAMIVAGCLVALAIVTPDASAVPASVQRPKASATADVLPTVQTNGVVWATEIVGDTVYAGGEFTSARPAGAALGTDETPRGHLLAFSLSTGKLITSFAPSMSSTVQAMALSPDKSRLYVVGQFGTVTEPGKAAVSKPRIAAFSTATGALITSFSPPSFDNRIYAVTASNSTVYVGGQFKNLGRTRLAALRASDGALTAWAPKTNNIVRSLTMNQSQSRVIVGGSFDQVTVGSTTTEAIGITSVDASSGAVQPFAVNQVVKNGVPPPSGVVQQQSSAGTWSLNTVGNTVYGTAFSTRYVGNFEGTFAVNGDTGAITWLADCHGDSYDSSVANGVVYVVSHWHICKNIGGFQDTSPDADYTRSFNRADAVTVAPAGTVAKNTEGDPGNFAGQPAPALVNWFPSPEIPTTSEPRTGQNQAAWATTATSKYVVIGGEFPRVNGTAQMGLARFSVPTAAGGNAPSKQGPMATADQQKPVVRSLGTTAARVSWPTSWDRDDMVLRYDLYRSDKTAPIFTVSKGSFFWNRPWLGFDDKNLTSGASYTYSVKVTDPDGNSVTSAPNTVTVGATPVSDSAYSEAVKTDAPTSYWRMNDRVGSKLGLDWLTKFPLSVRSGVTFGAEGATGDGDTAATFSGTENGVGATGSLATAPNTFTVEMWFKTTSTTGGKLIGFGDYQPIDKAGGGVVQSAVYDRMVYMGNDGKLNFGVKPTVARAIVTPKAYNDGQWHQVVATLSSTGANQGMVMYVDGAEVVRSTPNTTFGYSFSGFWRVGGDNLTRWWHEPSSYYFKGSIDDVAVWNTKALSASRIAAHYAAATG